MVSSRQQVPPCPVCQRTDQVMRLPTAYETGMQRFAPPPMPVAKVPMMPFILIGFALITLGSFFILIWSGVGGYGGWPTAVQILQVVLTIAGILITLALSLIALLRVVKGDLNSQKLLPAWDEAMEKWRSLYYCKRDDVVFDPQTNKTFTDAALKSLLSLDVAATAHPTQTQTQSTAASHQ